MPQFDNLDMRLSVKDDATAALKRASEAQRELSGAMRDAREASKQAGDTTRSVAGDVFKGVAAWDLAKQAAIGLKDALVELASAAIGQERSMTRVNSTLESAGLATEEARAAVNDFAASMVNLGFDNNAASESMARLIASTGNVKDAQKLGALAADLAADRQISLAEATTVLNQVITGNQRVLKGYGVQMDDNASSAEALAALQEKVGGRAQDMAADTQGAIDIAKAKWGEFTEQLAGPFLGTLRETIGKFGDHLTALSHNKAKMEEIQRTIYQVAQFFKGMGLSVWAVIKTLVQFGLTIVEWNKLVITAVGEVAKAFFALGDNIGTIIEAAKKALVGDFAGAGDVLKNRIREAFAGTAVSMREFGAVTGAFAEDLTKSWGDAGAAFGEAFNPAGFKVATVEVGKASESVKQDFRGIGAAGGKSAGEVAAAAKKVAESMTTLAQDYRDVEMDIEESLAKLDEEHARTARSIGGKIGSLVDQLAELDAAYRKTTGSFDTNQAEAVVNQEAKIAELKQQLADERQRIAEGGSGLADTKRLDALQGQLNKEQAAYDAYIAANLVDDKALAEARRRAGETQFEREVEDIAARRELAKAEYLERKKVLQDTVKAEQDALAEEALVYEAKRQQYAETALAAIAFKDQYVGALANMKAQTIESANLMKQKLEEVKRTLAQIESAKNAAKIASATQAGVTGGTQKVEVKLDLGGVTVNNAADADRLVQQMGEKLLQTLRLAGLASG